jgi:hypothetical protein
LSTPGKWFRTFLRLAKPEINTERKSGPLKLKIGVLIIGSLYWDPDRQAWRDSRLLIDDTFVVRAPIRYGRLSENRGNTYTMVFSGLCEHGEAIVVRCQRDVATASDLITEAEQLWAAERLSKPNRRICANWGSVALLCHPDRDIPQALLDSWAGHVSGDQDYGHIPQAAGEAPLISERGILQIPWPALINGGKPLAVDLLLATGNHPTLTGEPKSYPNAQTIADAWLRDTHNNVKYFRNNIQAGIRTFEDGAIAARLA